VAQAGAEKAGEIDGIHGEAECGRSGASARRRRLFGTSAVPLFYFRLRNGLDVPNDKGESLPYADAARAYATEFARFELSEAVKREGRIGCGR